MIKCKLCRYVWVITRNSLLLLIVLEIVLSFIYNYRTKKEYDDYIKLKIDAGVHKNMKNQDVTKLYYEYLELDMAWAPYTHFKPRAYSGTFNTINANGQRKTLNYNNSLSNPIRIFCFGGSTMYGIGSTDENTIPSILSKLLSKKYPTRNFEVINFGIPGYSRDLESIQLKQELINNNIPDIVIFYDGVNEVLTAFQNKRIDFPMNSSKRIMEFNSSQSYAKKAKLLIKSSYTMRMIRFLQKKLLKNRFSDTIDLSQKLATKITDNFRSNLYYSGNLSKAYNYVELNFLQPTIFSKNQLSDYEEIMKKNEAYMSSFYDVTYKQIANDSIINNNVSYKDISQIFSTTNTTIFSDFCHTAEEGNTIVALEMLNEIDAALAIKNTEDQNQNRE